MSWGKFIATVGLFGAYLTEGFSFGWMFLIFFDIF